MTAAPVLQQQTQVGALALLTPITSRYLEHLEGKLNAALAISDAVNLASRLEGMSKELECDIVLSEDLYKQVAEHVDAEPLRNIKVKPLRDIKVKGRDKEVMVYRLIGLEGEASV